MCHCIIQVRLCYDGGHTHVKSTTWDQHCDKRLPLFDCCADTTIPRLIWEVGPCPDLNRKVFESEDKEHQLEKREQELNLREQSITSREKALALKAQRLDAAEMSLKKRTSLTATRMGLLARVESIRQERRSATSPANFESGRENAMGHPNAVSSRLPTLSTESEQLRKILPTENELLPRAPGVDFSEYGSIVNGGIQYPIVPYIENHWHNDTGAGGLQLPGIPQPDIVESSPPQARTRRLFPGTYLKREVVDLTDPTSSPSTPDSGEQC